MRKYHSDKRNHSDVPDETGDAQQQVTGRPSALPVRNPHHAATTPQQPRIGSDISPERHYGTKDLSQRGTSVPYDVNGWCHGCHKSRLPNHGSLGPGPSYSGQCTCMNPFISLNLDVPFRSSFQVDSKQVHLLHLSECLRVLSNSPLNFPSYFRET